MKIFVYIVAVGLLLNGCSKVKDEKAKETAVQGQQSSAKTAVQKPMSTVKK